MREFNDVSGPFTRMREDGYFPFVQAQYLLCQSHADAVAGCHIFVFTAVEELEQVLCPCLTCPHRRPKGG